MQATILPYVLARGLEATHNLRWYANLGPVITEAIAHYASDVRSGEFPGPDEAYATPEDLIN